MDDISLLSQTVSDTLKDLAYMGHVLEEKARALEKQNEHSELDINHLEYVTLSVANLLKNCKGNMLAIINKLQLQIEEVNKKQVEKLCEETIEKLIQCRTVQVTLGENNEFVFVQPCDKGTLVTDRDIEFSSIPNNQCTNEKSKTEVDNKDKSDNPKKYLCMDLKDKNEKPTQCNNQPENMAIKNNSSNTGEKEEIDDIYLDSSFRRTLENKGNSVELPSDKTGVDKFEHDHFKDNSRFVASENEIYDQELEVKKDVIFIASGSEIFVEHDSNTGFFLDYNVDIEECDFGLKKEDSLKELVAKMELTKQHQAKDNEQNLDSEDSPSNESPWSIATEKLFDSDNDTASNDIANLDDVEDISAGESCTIGNNVMDQTVDSNEIVFEKDSANQSEPVIVDEDKQVNVIMPTASNKVEDKYVGESCTIGNNVIDQTEIIDSDETDIEEDSTNHCIQSQPVVTEEHNHVNVAISKDDSRAGNNIDEIADSLGQLLSELDGEKQDGATQRSNQPEEGLMDVTMIEILNNSFSEEETEKLDTHRLSDKIFNQSVEGPNVGDELLHLLKDFKIPTRIKKEPLETYEKDGHDEFSEPDIDEANKFIKELEETADSFSETESTNSNSSVLSISSDVIKNIIEDRSDDDDKNRIKEKSKLLNYLNLTHNKFNQKSYVELVRVDKIKLDGKQSLGEVIDKSIDRLCNLDTINKKRKASSHSSDDDLKNVRKRAKKKNIATTSFDVSDTDTDVELLPKNTPLELSIELENKLDDFLARKCLDDLKSPSENDNSQGSDASNMVSDKKQKKEQKSIKKKEKKLLDEMEKRRQAWRNDPLLKGKLSDSDSSTDRSTDSDDSTNSKKRTKKVSRYEQDSDFDLSSDMDSRDGDKIAKKVGSPNKLSSDTSDNTNSDSDLEFISMKEATPKKSKDKGRKNIRALMSEESLNIATQIANKEERARIERLEERQKIRESYTQSITMSQTMSQAWSCSSADEDDPFILDIDEDKLTPLVKVHPKLTKKLKPHQKEGVQFMWDSCYESIRRLKRSDGSGCILAHCMGLGKTYQVLTLIHTLFSHKETNTNRVLVVCPLSTVTNWKNEVNIAFKGLSEEKFKIFTISDRKEKSDKYNIVSRWSQKKNTVLVVGYECFELLTNEVKLSKVTPNHKRKMLEALVNPGPDLVVCDEGHLLRNKKALKTLALNKIKTKRRIVLTGTPLQNNLLEYYYMVQFVKPNLLGDCQEFKTNFVNPITNGQYEDSTKEDIKLMKKRTHVLHKLLKKTIQRFEDTVLKMYLPKMVDHAIFLQLHPLQVDLYNKFLDEGHEVSMKINRKGFLSDFSNLQFIGTHPYLLALTDEMHGKTIKETDVITNENDNFVPNKVGWWKTLVPENVADRIELGTKLLVLISIIEECEKINDKLIVFSQSLAELNLIEHFLRKIPSSTSWIKKLDYNRMDGTVPVEDRNSICDRFNDKNNKRFRLLLMSTKVGGLGLNLTGANRVVIMTVNWNPSYDSQSVFRTYRFGQTKEVYVYRLVSLGTMEEKVYQRTVTKLAIAHRVVDKHQIARHYKSVDLLEMYHCRPTIYEERPTPNVPNDKVLAKLILKFPCIYKYHEHQTLLANNPEDDLDEQEKRAAWEEFEKQKEAQSKPSLTPQPAMQNILPNGPTFEHAYALGVSNLNNVMAQNIDIAKTNGLADPLSKQYYNSGPSTNKNIDKLSKQSYMSSEKSNQKISNDITVTIDDSPEKTTESDRNIRVNKKLDFDKLNSSRPTFTTNEGGALPKKNYPTDDSASARINNQELKKSLLKKNTLKINPVIEKQQQGYNPSKASNNVSSISTPTSMNYNKETQRKPKDSIKGAGIPITNQASNSDDNSATTFSKYISPLGIRSSQSFNRIQDGQNQNKKRLKTNLHTGQIPIIEIEDEGTSAQNTRPVLKECSTNAVSNPTSRIDNDVITLD